MQGTSAFPWGDDALRDFKFGCTGRSQAADGSASVKRRTGRKEKPYQDNAKTPKRAKFHRREVNLSEGNRRQCPDRDQRPADCASLLGGEFLTQEQGDTSAQHRPCCRDKPDFRHCYDVFLHTQTYRGSVKCRRWLPIKRCRLDILKMKAGG